MNGETMRKPRGALSLEVIEAVASREGIEPTDLPPLSDSINPDALDTLFEPRLDGTPRRGGQVRFEYGGYTVVVQGDNQVILNQ